MCSALVVLCCTLSPTVCISALSTITCDCYIWRCSVPFLNTSTTPACDAGIQPIRPGENPASWMLDQIGGGVEQNQARTDGLVDNWQHSEPNRKLTDQVASIEVLTPLSPFTSRFHWCARVYSVPHQGLDSSLLCCQVCQLTELRRLCDT